MRGTTPAAGARREDEIEKRKPEREQQKREGHKTMRHQQQERVCDEIENCKPEREQQKREGHETMKHQQQERERDESKKRGESEMAERATGARRASPRWCSMNSRRKNWRK